MPNDILAGLQGLGAYLKDENRLRKDEFEKEKQKISAQRIATGFKTLTSENSESDARQLVYSLINDAASLDSLNANLPLIDSLYRDSVSGIKNYKAEKQDAALREYAQSEYGVNAPADLSGAQVLELAKTNKQMQDEVNTVNAAGQKVLKITNAKGQVIREMMTDERTDEQQKELDFKYSRRLAGYQHGLNSTLKAYAGLTDGGLPLMMGADGLYVQTGGQLVKYDENLHGTINKGNSYNTPTGGFKTYEDQFDYYKKLNKDAYITTNTTASSLGEVLGVTPAVDMSTGEAVTNYTNAILNKYGTKQDLWNALREKVPGDDESSMARRKVLYQNMEEFYRGVKDLNDTKNAMRIGAAEQESQLPIGSFKKIDEYAFNLISSDVSKIPSEYRSEAGIKNLITNATTPEAKAEAEAMAQAWILKSTLYNQAQAEGKKLNSPEEYQNYYNSLGYKKKAKLFKKEF